VKYYCNVVMRVVWQDKCDSWYGLECWFGTWWWWV